MKVLQKLKAALGFTARWTIKIARAGACLVLGGIVLLNLLIPIQDRMRRSFPTHKVYGLIVMTISQGGLSLLLPPMRVVNVYKKDELLCYTVYETGRNFCTKYPIYTLTELN